jgi:chitodextrinase
MPTDQNSQPQVKSGFLRVTKITKNSISIEWEPASKAKPDPMRYRIGLTKEYDVTDPWHIVHEGKEIYAYTFTGLDPNTDYGFYVKAFDGDELVVQYPVFNGCMTAKTLESDKEAPTVKSKAIRVTGIGLNSLSIQWESATDDVTAASKIRYEVWLKKSNTPSDPWHLKANQTGINSFTFTGLEKGTMYSFFVRAYDESGNFLQYPLANGCMTAKTAALDKEAPTVESRALMFKDIKHDRFTVTWRAAKDNVTEAAKIRYTIHTLYSDCWCNIAGTVGVTSCTVTGLTPETQYWVYITAEDEAGNVLRYPNDAATVGVMTAAEPVNKLTLSIKQGATVLRGTDTIMLELSYTCVQYNEHDMVSAHQTGTWTHKWSSNANVNTVIQLPPNWFIDKNRVHVVIKSRRAASAGLNKWKVCCEGDVYISRCKLALQLSGSYYSYSVKYTQIK